MGRAPVGLSSLPQGWMAVKFPTFSHIAVQGLIIKTRKDCRIDRKVYFIVLVAFKIVAPTETAVLSSLLASKK